MQKRIGLWHQGLSDMPLFRSCFSAVFPLLLVAAFERKMQTIQLVEGRSVRERLKNSARGDQLHGSVSNPALGGLAANPLHLQPESVRAVENVYIGSDVRVCFFPVNIRWNRCRNSQDATGSAPPDRHRSSRGLGLQSRHWQWGCKRR